LIYIALVSHSASCRSHASGWISSSHHPINLAAGLYAKGLFRGPLGALIEIDARATLLPFSSDPPALSKPVSRDQILPA
jgi:hypothetical protein